MNENRILEQEERRKSDYSIFHYDNNSFISWLVMSLGRKCSTCKVYEGQRLHSSI